MREPFVPAVLDHRWYGGPYFLSPDQDPAQRTMRSPPPWRAIERAARPGYGSKFWSIRRCGSCVSSSRRRQARKRRRRRSRAGDRKGGRGGARRRAEAPGADAGPAAKPWSDVDAAGQAWE